MYKNRFLEIQEKLKVSGVFCSLRRNILSFKQNMSSTKFQANVYSHNSADNHFAFPVQYSVIWGLFSDTLPRHQLCGAALIKQVFTFHIQEVVCCWVTQSQDGDSGTQLSELTSLICYPHLFGHRMALIQTLVTASRTEGAMELRLKTS